MHIHRWSNREGTRGIRSFAYIYEHEDGKSVAELSCEAYVASGARNTGVALDLGDGASLRAHAGVAHLFDVYLGAESGRLAGHLYRRGGAWREWARRLTDLHVVSLSVHDGALWWAFWHLKAATPRLSDATASSFRIFASRRIRIPT